MMINRIALEWAIRSFGIDHVYNIPLRTLRLAEEVVELAQANGIPKTKMHDLIDIVYSRPPGYPEQELGGVMLTALLLTIVSSAANEPNEFLESELCRVLAKSPDHFRKRNQEKLELGLDINDEPIPF